MLCTLLVELPASVLSRWFSETIWIFLNAKNPPFYHQICRDPNINPKIYKRKARLKGIR